MTAREFTGTLALCAAVAGVIVALVLGSPQPARQPVPVFTPSAFCPSGQHMVKARGGEPVCATPRKQTPFDFRPGRPS